VELERKIVESLDDPELWLVVTFRTAAEPSETLKMLSKIVEDAGWTVTFKANWWTADIPYGLVRLDLQKGGREKILLGKWILGSETKPVAVESMPLEKGRDEFFRMVDSITSTLIHDPVIRTMREQY